MEIQRNMATAMRVLKEERGKSLAEFAAELEISRSALQEYLSGRGNPNVATIEHLAQKLGTDTLFLVSGAFSCEQLDVLLKLLDTLKLLSDLPQNQRQHFAELLLEMVLLWERGDDDG